MGASSMKEDMISFQTALQEELKGLFVDFRFYLRHGELFEMCYFSFLKRERPSSDYRHYITLTLPKELSPESIKAQAQRCVRKAILDLKQAGHI